MERAINILLFRAVELLLGIPLWNTFSPATCIGDCIHLFMAQSELAQIGAITVVAIMAKALYRIVVGLGKARSTGR